MRCLDCKHSRQVGDLKRTDKVGCALMAAGYIADPVATVEKADGCLYSGYIYGGRSPGDTGPSKELGKGTLTLSTIVDAESSCGYFVRRVSET